MFKCRKAVYKDFFMEIKKSRSRFISIFLIVALGVAFYTGVRSSEPDMKYSADKLYDETSFMDIRLISSLGITDDELEKLSLLPEVDEIAGVNTIDVMVGTDESESVIRIWSYNDKVNIPIIENGRIPENVNECIIDANYLKNNNLSLGDKIQVKSGTERDINASLKETEYTITGTFISPMYLSLDKGTTTIGNGKINGVIMVDNDVFINDYYQEAHITVTDGKKYIAYTDKYNSCVDDAKIIIQQEFEKINADKYEKLSAIYNDIKKPAVYVLDRNSIITYAEYEQDTERINNIGKVVPMIFFIVAALVSLTTMTRMVEEQRVQIGTLKALGYRKISIAGKYLWYALSATLLGSLTGGILGSIIFPKIILSAYKILYDNLIYIVIKIVPRYFIMAILLAVGCVVAATLASCLKELMAVPSVLMRPVAPKPGKRIILEKIPFIWKHINFSRKSTFRNLLRYKKRLFMTLFGIGGCMSLLLVGFGLEDSINDVIYKQYGELTHYDLVVNLEPNVTDVQIDEVDSYLQSEENIEEYIEIKNSAATFESHGKSISGYIYVTDDIDKFNKFFTLRHRKNHKKVSLSDDGVVISEKMSRLLDINKGDKITLKLSDSVMAEVTVSEIAENYVYHNVYMTESTYEKLFGTTSKNQILLKLNSQGIKNEEKIAEKLLSMDAAGGTTYIDSMKNKFDDMLGSLDIVVVLLVVSAGGLAFIVLYNLNNINITERQRELATLKVLGFYDGEVSQYILRENIIITLIGIFLGVIGGLVLHRYVISTVEVDLVMFGRTIKPFSYLYSILITVIFAAIVNLSMHFKLKKVDMATSLKSGE